MLTIITQRSSFQFISNNKGSHVPSTESREGEAMDGVKVAIMLPSYSFGVMVS